ncbi:MAG: chemotaxis protein CheC [Candidatus Methanoperedens sp.]|nr:chemotaxis protein CheC [Candidatus Methanoperedens sp.]
MKNIRTLTDFQKDALKEVGNIGIGHATTSLSKMVNKKVGVSLPDMKLIPLLDVPALVRNEDPVVGIILQLTGEANGFMMLLLSKRTAKTLIKLIYGQSDETQGFDEMEVSVLKEMANIMGGTYISSLSNFLSISISSSTPSQAYDMSDAIIDQVLGFMGADVNDVLFLKTEFFINEEQVDGNILIFTDSDSLRFMLDAINRMV